MKDKLLTSELILKKKIIKLERQLLQERAIAAYNHERSELLKTKLANMIKTGIKL